MSCLCVCVLRAGVCVCVRRQCVCVCEHVKYVSVCECVCVCVGVCVCVYRGAHDYTPRLPHISSPEHHMVCIMS